MLVKLLIVPSSRDLSKFNKNWHVLQALHKVKQVWTQAWLLIVVTSLQLIARYLVTWIPTLVSMTTMQCITSTISHTTLSFQCFWGVCQKMKQHFHFKMSERTKVKKMQQIFWTSFSSLQPHPLEPLFLSLCLFPYCRTSLHVLHVVIL